jgi:hypothetical protein
MLRAWRTRIGTKVIRMAFLFSVPQTTVLLLLLLLPCSLPTVATAAAALSTSVYLVVFQLVKLQACPQFWCIVEQSQHDTKFAATVYSLTTCYHSCFSACKSLSMSTIIFTHINVIQESLIQSYSLGHVEYQQSTMVCQWAGKLEILTFYNFSSNKINWQQTGRNWL